MVEAIGIPIAMSILQNVVYSTLGVIAGMAMLRGLNWGRLLYLWYVPIFTVLNWVLWGFHFIFMSILGIIFYISYPCVPLETSRIKIGQAISHVERKYHRKIDNLVEFRP